MKTRGTFFSGNYIDRCGEIRIDPDALDLILTESATRFLVVRDEQCAVDARGLVEIGAERLDTIGATIGEAIFLGKRDDRHLFVVSAGAAPGDGVSFEGLRELSATLPEADAALAAYAKAMIGWRDRHRFCGRCGAANLSREGGFIMACPNPECDHRSFPRLDPAVIVLVHRNDRCLLGRQVSWSEGRFSTIAGFVEPGESLEDSIRREVREETNIEVGRCDYLASQPWPFPSALMIGYHAEGLTDDIRLNDGELAEARWLSRDEIDAGAVTLPPKFSVAYRLIEAWFEDGTDRRLDPKAPSPPRRA